MPSRQTHTHTDVQTKQLQKTRCVGLWPAHTGFKKFSLSSSLFNFLRLHNGQHVLCCDVAQVFQHSISTLFTKHVIERVA